MFHITLIFLYYMQHESVSKWDQLLTRHPFLRTFETRLCQKVPGRSGVPELFPIQEDSLAKIDNADHPDKNLLCCGPTACGKTLVGMFTIMHLIHCTKRESSLSKGWARSVKVVYVAPTKALCDQKYEELKEYFGQNPMKDGEQINIFHYSSSERDNDNFNQFYKSQITVCTPEICMLLFRGMNSINVLNLLIIDQLHEVGLSKRGWIIETLVATALKQKNRRKIEETSRQPSKTRRQTEETRFKPLRVLGMSASIPNKHEVEEWLDATLIEPGAMQVKLRLITLRPEKTNSTKFLQYSDMRIKPEIYGLKKYQNFQNTPTYARDMDMMLIEFLVQRNLKGIKQQRENYLIFCNRKIVCQRLTLIFSQIVRFVVPRPNCRITETEVRQYIGGLTINDTLKGYILKRVAYHHASMRDSQKKAVLKLMEQGWLVIVCCTETLAQGVNQPADLVIIYDLEKYKPKKITKPEESDSEVEDSEDQAESGAKYPIRIIDQMIGRAGRGKEVGYCCFLGKASHVAYFEGIINNHINAGQSLQVQQVDSRLSSNMDDFLLFNACFGTEGENYSMPRSPAQMEQLQKSLDYTFLKVRNPDRYNQARQNVSQSIMVLRDDYGIDNKILEHVYKSYISFQTYKRVFQTIQRAGQTQLLPSETQKQFLCLISGLQQMRNAFDRYLNKLVVKCSRRISRRMDYFQIESTLGHNVDQTTRDLIFSMKRYFKFSGYVHHEQFFHRSLQHKFGPAQHAENRQKIKDNFDASRSNLESLSKKLGSILKLVKFIYQLKCSEGQAIENTYIIFWTTLYLKYINDKYQASHLNLKKCAELLGIKYLEFLNLRKVVKFDTQHGFFAVRQCILKNQQEIQSKPNKRALYGKIWTQTRDRLKRVQANVYYLQGQGTYIEVNGQVGEVEYIVLGADKPAIRYYNSPHQAEVRGNGHRVKISADRKGFTVIVNFKKYIGMDQIIQVHENKPERIQIIDIKESKTCFRKKQKAGEFQDNEQGNTQQGQADNSLGPKLAFKIQK